MTSLTTSIVIATDGRRDALAQTLKALQYLEGPDVEVIVVMGPTKDGTDEVVAAWGDAIKTVFLQSATPEEAAASAAAQVREAAACQ